MANICDNEFYAYSETKENIDYIENYLSNDLSAVCDRDNESIDARFDSNWTFPTELMNELYEGIPNKSDIFMRCLSVEYGCDYVAYHKCEEDGWYSV